MNINAWSNRTGQKLHFWPLYLISSACVCSCHTYTSFSWAVDKHMTKSRHYALLNRLSDSYQHACSPPNSTTSLPDWGWFSGAQHKTEGCQARRGVSAWRCSAAAGTPAPGPALGSLLLVLLLLGKPPLATQVLNTPDLCLPLLQWQGKYIQKEHKKKQSKTKIKQNPRDITLHDAKTQMQRTVNWWLMHKVIATMEEGLGSTGLNNHFQHSRVIFFLFPGAFCRDNCLISVIIKCVFVGCVFLSQQVCSANEKFFQEIEIYSDSFSNCKLEWRHFCC